MKELMKNKKKILTKSQLDDLDHVVYLAKIWHFDFFVVPAKSAGELNKYTIANARCIERARKIVNKLKQEQK